MRGRLDRWDGRSLFSGAAALLEVRERHLGELAGPWSIAELSLTDDDFEKLLTWAKHADGTAITTVIGRTDLLQLPDPRRGERHQGDAIAGLVLLALCAECAARLGSSEAPWPAIYGALGDCSLRRSLFSQNGAALGPLKEAFLAAARRFWMRSGDLDDARNNRWYQLLLLQGGVPRNDLSLLSARLSNPDGRTFLISALRSEVPAFRQAWDSLERFRRGEVSRGAARREIEKCPFVRSSPEEMLDAAARTNAAPHALADANAGKAFGVNVRLDWPHAAAAPKVLMTPTFSTDESFGARVIISVDGIARATFRRSGGALVPFSGVPIILTPAVSWGVSARGTSQEEESVAVDLFEGEAVVACFDGGGVVCATGARATRYVIAREPVVADAALRVAWFESEGVSVAEVEEGTVLTSTDGVRLWPPEKSSEDVDLSTLTIASSSHGPERGAVEIVLRHAASLRVVGARVGSVAFSVNSSESSGTATMRGVMSARDATPDARLTVTVARSDRRLTQRTLRFRALTAASIDGAWLESEPTIDAARLRAGALRITLGPEFEGRDARVVAGGLSTPIIVGQQRPRRAIRALGYGEPLILAGQEPWVAGDRQTIAHVVNHGEVLGHELSAREIRIRHGLPLDQTEGFWVLVWPRRGAPIAIALGSGAFEDANAIVVPRPQDGDPRAVAICYGNAALGASWASDWSADLCSAAVDAAMLVKLVRLLALPVLGENHRVAITTRLRELGIAAATIALLESSEERRVLEVDAAHELRPFGDGERWPHVVRALALELRLSSRADVDALHNAAGERSVPSPFTPRPGVPATPDELAQHAEWRLLEIGRESVFERMLLAAGAVHPRDAIAHTAYRDQRRLALRLAGGALGISAEGRNLARVRRAQFEARRRQLGLSEGTVAPLIVEAEAWATTPIVPQGLLREALVDERMFQRVQIELLQRLAFPNE